MFRSLVVLALAGCEVSTPSPDARSDTAPTAYQTAAAVENVLLVILDDIGIDNVAAYGVAPEPPRTPVLDGLAEQGVLFRNAYASPLCSPTRANLMTGRYGRRTGIGHLVHLHDEVELPRSEIGIAEMLDYSPDAWSTSQIGKQHLAARAKSDDPATHPADMGFDWFAGSLNNLQVTLTSMTGTGYQHWEKNVNGVLGPTGTYATRDTTNDAIARIRAMPEPWFAWVSYNGAHDPWHMPPPDLHHVDEELSGPASLPVKFDAMVESVDTELGRLLNGMRPEVRARTTIIVIGDNGTMAPVITPPFDPERGNGTVYEGGVRVPLIVAGPRVAQPGSETRAFVHAVDLFTTVADIANVPLEGPGAPPFAGPIDGASLLPWLADPDRPSDRQYVFAEKFRPNGHVPETSSHRTIHDGRYKLTRTTRSDGVFDALYRLGDNPLHEGDDLLLDGPDALTDQERAAYDDLSTALEAFVAERTPAR